MFVLQLNKGACRVGVDACAADLFAQARLFYLGGCTLEKQKTQYGQCYFYHAQDIKVGYLPKTTQPCTAGMAEKKYQTIGLNNQTILLEMRQSLLDCSETGLITCTFQDFSILDDALSIH